MTTDFFKNKKVTVFGLGLHGGGAGTVKFLANQGAKIIVTDIKTREQLSDSLEKLKGLKNVEYILGQHRREDFTKADMVIKTPAAPWNNKHIKLALENNVPVEVDSSLFFRLCQNPIIGITGTKGKTTTATVIYEILKLAGKNPVKVGVGQVSVLDKLEKLKKDSVAVFELSSWRLSALGKIKKSPPIAVLSNIFPDHLNYYQSMESYIKDKKNIFLYQDSRDWLITNEDDENLRSITKEAKSQAVKYSKSPIKNGHSIFMEDEVIYLNDGVDIKKIISSEDLKIKGRHNVGNIMAAIGATYAYGVEVSKIKEAVRNFEGIAHRLELVGEMGGVKFYNDTAATIPEATISALDSFTQPIILIAGGADKNLDFSRLSKTIAGKVKGLVLLKGSATEELARQIKKDLPEEENEKIEIVDSINKAVEIAYRSAEAGDIILLSPGAASFGLFLNEFDRGNKFKEAVKNLAG
ncbi:UDP-N-acetylmuramoyl-L-alanine--D-glutamate ligase [bacterium]|nr:UDP-N-acetylmuramoyl-L-alanine--D-glutamate ligase [bacterium]